MAKEELKTIKNVLPSLSKLIGRYQSDKTYSIKLSQSQARVLQCLVSYNRPITVNELADSIGSARSTTSEILKRMVKKKLISQKRDEVDGRRVFVEPAKKGLDLVKTRDDLIIRRYEDIINKMSASERNEFLSAHKAIAKIIDKGLI